MKIVIVGAGALGSLLGASLVKSKEEIWLLDKNKERAAKIHSNGILVEGISGKWSAKLKSTADPKFIGVADLVIIAVKAYHTKSAIIFAKPLIGDETNVLTLQNGIGNIEIIGEVVGTEKVIGGITSIGSTLLDVGHVRHAGHGETVIGRLDGKMPNQIRSIREVFNKAGIELKFSKDIRSVLWSKLIINVGINALSAIARLPNGKLTEYDGTRKILREAVTEAIRVAKRKRIKLIYDDPLAKVEAVCEATATNKSSMLQDILKNKPTEIDFINGVIVRFAQELSIAVPVNTMLLEIVKTIESSYDYSVLAV